MTAHSMTENYIVDLFESLKQIRRVQLREKTDADHINELVHDLYNYRKEYDESEKINFNYPFFVGMMFETIGKLKDYID